MGKEDTGGEGWIPGRTDSARLKTQGGRSPQEEAVSLWIFLKPVSITLQYLCSPFLKQRIKSMVWRPWGRCGGISLQGEILIFCFQLNGTTRIIKNPRAGSALWCLSSASAVLRETERLSGPRHAK